MLSCSQSIHQKRRRHMARVLLGQVIILHSFNERRSEADEGSEFRGVPASPPASTATPSKGAVQVGKAGALVAMPRRLVVSLPRT